MIPQQHDQRLNALLTAYRGACEFGDAGPDFMPQLWQRIESRRVNAIFSQRVARIFTTASVALAVASAILVSFVPQRPLDETWVEAIANQNLAQNVAYYEPVRLSPAPR